MQNDKETATSAPSASEASSRKCPGCGVSFPSGGRGLGKTFHNDACRLAFHAVHRKEGFPLAPLIKASLATRHAKPGTREAEICRFARSQIARICRDFLDQDEEAGRNIVEYVGGLMDSGILHTDRQAWLGR